MHKEILTFGYTEIEKDKFYRHKCPVFLEYVDIEKVFVSKKISSDEKNKHFIGYLHNEYKVKPLHIMFPKTSAHVKSYDGQTKWMYFLIEDDDLLEKYNTILDKVSAKIKNEFDSKYAYNEKFLIKNKNLMGMKLQFFTIKEFLRWILIMLFSSNQLGFCSQER